MHSMLACADGLTIAEAHWALSECVISLASSRGCKLELLHQWFHCRISVPVTKVWEVAVMICLNALQQLDELQS